MVRARILPPEEWDRVAHVPDMATVLPLFRQDDVKVVVVEEGDRVIAAWAVLRIPHFEGVWIAPEARGRVSVVRQLFRTMLDAVAPWAKSWVITGAQPHDRRVKQLIAELGGQPIPIDHYLLPLERMEALCRSES